MSAHDRLARAQVVLGAVGVVVGLAGLWQARDVAFTADRGVIVGWGSYELAFMRFNKLGALIVIALAGIGLVAGLLRRPVLGWIPAAGFALVALQVLVQWRPDGTNLLGAHGSNLGFALAMALGFGVTAALSGLADSAPEPAPATDP